MINSALYSGRIAHKRHLPKPHDFSYPFFMYYLNLDKLQNLPDLGRWFSIKNWAISRFHRPDYYGSHSSSLSDAIRQRMTELTGKEVLGTVCGLLNLRTLGLYFSPVNFYYGFDTKNRFTHFLAEVSNTPWNERYQYGFYVGDGNLAPQSQKRFKVSPFNPVEQNYSWNISPPGQKIGVQLGVNDERGMIFQAALSLKQQPLTQDVVRKHLLTSPAMTISTLSRIHWQALKLYLKGLPYIPYTKERI